MTYTEAVELVCTEHLVQFQLYETHLEVHCFTSRQSLETDVNSLQIRKQKTEKWHNAF